MHFRSQFACVLETGGCIPADVRVLWNGRGRGSRTFVLDNARARADHTIY